MDKILILLPPALYGKRKNLYMPISERYKYCNWYKKKGMILNFHRTTYQIYLLKKERSTSKVIHTCRFKLWRLCIKQRSRLRKDVNRLFERSKSFNLVRADNSEGNLTNLLLVILRDTKLFKQVISIGRVLILLNERSKYSSLLRQPISGGRYLQKRGGGRQESGNR